MRKKKSPLDKEIKIADKLTAVLGEAIDDEKQFYRYIVKEKNGSDSGEEERIFEKMDMQAFNNAIKALDALAEIKRGMYGILSPLEERKLADNKTSGNEKEENEMLGDCKGLKCLEKRLSFLNYSLSLSY